MRLNTPTLILVLIVSLVACTAASQTGQVAMFPTLSVTRQVTTATLTPVPPQSATPLPSPTVWLEPTHVPTPFPGPTPASEESNMPVLWNEGVALTKYHPQIMGFWERGDRSQMEVTLVDGVVVFEMEFDCGDECIGSRRLAFRDNGAGELPAFLSLYDAQYDYFDQQSTAGYITDGTMIIQEWDTSGIISGKIESPNQDFYFWHNFGNAKEDLLAYHLKGGVVLTDELIAALNSDDLYAKRDALLIIRDTCPDAPIPHLIQALTDVTPIPEDGSNNTQWRFVSNEVAFTLSAMLSKKDSLNEVYTHSVIPPYGGIRSDYEAWISA